MTVYEARTNEHFQKILSWLKTQPPKCFPFRCWQLEAAQCQTSLLTGAFFSRLKELKQGINVFVCEDETRKIKLIAFRERRGKEFNPKEPQIALGLRAFPDQGDFDGNFDFVKETVEWATRDDFHKYGIDTLYYDIPDLYLPLMQKIYGDALEIIKENEAPPMSKVFLPELTKIYEAKISVKKYLGLP